MTDKLNTMYHAQIVTINTKEGIKKVPVMSSPVGLLTGESLKEGAGFEKSMWDNKHPNPNL